MRRDDEHLWVNVEHDLRGVLDIHADDRPSVGIEVSAALLKRFNNFFNRLKARR